MVDLQAREQQAGDLGRAYKSVAEYDPVLRAHCRSDKAG
jgi:hypothetical protein